ncbi:MAG: Lrp/AsnC family transcriptional regulator [Gemmatimonadota bacterium]|nr:MAG: Lrp/AsnC family transcriptional regulator [Gemmatimonadota bacterium]
MHAVFVMIKCELSTSYEVAAHIADNIEETSELFSVSGEYDLLAKFHLQDDDDVGHFVCDRLQRTPHLRDTFTLDTFNAFTV